MEPIFLASASPRRAALLEAAGVPFTLCPTDCDESLRPSEGPVEYARRIARLKLDTARAQRRTGTWLAADTVVWFPPEGPPIGKPRDAAHAREIIAQLTAGLPHRVTTAWALGVGAQDPRLFDETTSVWMRPLLPAELDSYLATDAWRDKAGGYAIQGRAAGWVTRIEGSYTNVMGLPLAQVLDRIDR